MLEVTAKNRFKRDKAKIKKKKIKANERVTIKLKKMVQNLKIFKLTKMDRIIATLNISNTVTFYDY